MGDSYEDEQKQEIYALRYRVDNHEAILKRLEANTSALTESMAKFLVHEHKHDETQETIKRMFRRLEATENRTSELYELRIGPRLRDTEKGITDLERVLASADISLNSYVRVWIERLFLVVAGAGATYLFTVL